MTEHVKTGDTVYFVTNFYHPISGFSCAASATPNWFVCENNTTSYIYSGIMTARTNILGTYIGSFVASAINGFDSGSFYDVQVSGLTYGVSVFKSAKQFVLDDVFSANLVQISGQPVIQAGIINANIVQVSGQYVSPELVVDANIVQVSGQPVSQGGIVDTNVVQVSGEPVSINDFGGTSSLTAQDVYNQASGALVAYDPPTYTEMFNRTLPSGQYGISTLTAAAVRQEMDTNSLMLVSISGDVGGLDGAAMRGTDNAALATNLMAVSGTILTSTQVYNQVSGALINLGIGTDIYFAIVDYTSDITNNNDEFTAQWYKNNTPLMSGSLTYPTISMYNTNTGVAVFENQKMSYASPRLGVVRYDANPMVVASGEPYLVQTSGIIDSSVRTWSMIIGTNLFTG